MLPIDVTDSGTVVLGHELVCDGFLWGAPSRVQTHVHDDHMTEFDRSKGIQNIFMSPPTRELLVAEHNLDLGRRQNLRSVQTGTRVELAAGSLTLVSSGHMLGAVQALYESYDGLRLGYSSDFQWPLAEVIQVDGLVVDSTYGNPSSRRTFDQRDVDAEFAELVRRLLTRGAVHVRAFRGTLQRALQSVAGVVDCPVVASPRLCREIDVYRRQGYALCKVLEVDSQDGKHAISSPCHIHLYAMHDPMPVDYGTGSSIVLSACGCRYGDPPVIAYTERAYRVAMTNHADFDGTLAYVEATGAKEVVCDNYRGGHAWDLAAEIHSRLGVDARGSSQTSRPEFLPE